MLTDRQKRFVFEYCKDFVATKAYVRAGYSERGADQASSRLLSNVEVLEAIEEQKEMYANVARLSPQWVIHQWMQLASANPADLVEVKPYPCQKCWGELPYSAKLPVNPECQACGGSGERRVIVKPTSELKGAAKLLYAGAVPTRDGVKVLMRDQNDALNKLADYLGMLNKGSRELTGPGGGPLAVVTANVADLSDDALAAIISSGSLRDGNQGVSLGVSEPLALPTTIESTQLES